jgi:hypothetical protein
MFSLKLPDNVIFKTVIFGDEENVKAILQNDDPIITLKSFSLAKRRGMENVLADQFLTAVNILRLNLLF